MVDSDHDSHDANLTDGICQDPDGKCTLRAAIEQAHHMGGSSPDKPHIIDLTKVKSDIQLHLGEMPPFTHVRLVGTDISDRMYAKNFVELNYKLQQALAQKRKVVYPNPAGMSTTLDLRGFNSDHLSITIINEFGHQVEFINLEGMRNVKLELDLSSYKNGTYWIKITQSEQQALLKQFVVDRF